MQQKEEFWVMLCTNMTTGYDQVKCNTRSPVVDFIILLCLCKAFDILIIIAIFIIIGEINLLLLKQRSLFSCSIIHEPQTL